MTKRVTCPICGRPNTALVAEYEYIATHYDPRKPTYLGSTGRRCGGSGKPWRNFKPVYRDSTRKSDECDICGEPLGGSHRWVRGELCPNYPR